MKQRDPRHGQGEIKFTGIQILLKEDSGMIQEKVLCDSISPRITRWAQKTPQGNWSLPPARNQKVIKGAMSLIKDLERLWGGRG
jgi:hypothetical protein